MATALEQKVGALARLEEVEAHAFAGIIEAVEAFALPRVKVAEARADKLTELVERNLAETRELRQRVDEKFNS